MAQNIYDNDTFFEGYSRLPRSVEGLDGAPEWPTLRAMLPALDGRRVLDLGCGFGWFCRWARQNGAASVLGVDVSERMLARAKAESDDVAITYARADLEDFQAGSAAFDLAYSSLALHYIANLERLIARVHAALVPGGSLIFSVEHPLFTAPNHPGWSIDAAGHATWPVDSYLDEGPRSTDWLAKGVIKQHRTIATYVNLLRRSGFTLSHIEEWGPTAEQLTLHPEWANERERPSFLLVACSRAAQR
ncbi:bifunctional 2-polyprenyl-6-hydroxyphenol methylase/3-demethylubiquinol 3-O-methyltransferase UbiG [Acidisphaera sp. S103]|uniref:class I SAM-dependent methyltransferase n=1 Tax=Acidisphaera sp. S103 TaxID=1747223 RepID=UPI00131EB0C9|nr:class I SAM-dependent methyltransferase [Acidisphaera sp. S103]